MDGEGKVECRTTGRQGAYLSLRCKHEDLRGKEVQLDGVEEVHRVGLRIVENLLDGSQPLVQLIFILRVFAIYTVFIFPVGGKALFRNLVHAVGTDLYLYPTALFGHQRHMECLIAIGLWLREPVAQPVGV